MEDFKCCAPNTAAKDLFVSQEDCFGIDVNCSNPTASNECSQQHCERQCSRFGRVYLAMYTTILQPTKG
jgi:hypothetical protein